ncbi:MAG: DUF4388 domain-containing protein [Candidatus Pacebacteria bacterium]|nr:DUF4388 domain-containing protein [Candidatus Paceibacterota bacterium]
MGAENPRIVLLDQDSAKAQSLAKTLEAAAECDVETHGDAATAAAAVVDSGPVAVMYGCREISSHALDGVTLLREAVGRLPLVAYTDSVHAVMRLRFMEAGADELFSENVLPQALPQVLTWVQAIRETEETKTEGGPAGEGQMYFQFKEGELSNVLQFICMTSRTGELALEFDDDTAGSVYVCDNTLTHAAYGKRLGVEAVARMIGRERGEARFFEGHTTPEVTNDKPVSQLLIEASVMADELKAGQSSSGGT